MQTDLNALYREVEEGQYFYIASSGNNLVGNSFKITESSNKDSVNYYYAIINHGFSFHDKITSIDCLHRKDLVIYKIEITGLLTKNFNKTDSYIVKEVFTNELTEKIRMYDDSSGIHYHNRRVVKKDGKFGYVDENGELAIDCKYDRAEVFTVPWASVVLNGEVEFIDINGKSLSKEEVKKMSNKYFRGKYE